MDGDFSESTRDTLVNLYDRLAIGGYAVLRKTNGRCGHAKCLNGGVTFIGL